MRGWEFKYRKDGKVVTVRADGTGLELPAYSNTWYRTFTINSGQYDKQKTVGRCKVSALLPGYEEKAKRLYRKPWMDRVSSLEKVSLWRAHSEDFGGLPDDAQDVWYFNGGRDNWIIQCKGRAVLHVFNNPERSKRGKTFAEALKKLFPGKQITINHPAVRTEVVR
jgi:hypothetical protein